MAWRFASPQAEGANAPESHAPSISLNWLASWDEALVAGVACWPALDFNSPVTLPSTVATFSPSCAPTGSKGRIRKKTPAKALLRTVTYRAVLVNDGGVPRGLGFFLLPELPSVGPPKTTLTTSRLLSGSVRLEALP